MKLQTQRQSPKLWKNIRETTNRKSSTLKDNSKGGS